MTKEQELAAIGDSSGVYEAIRRVADRFKENRAALALLELDIKEGAAYVRSLREKAK